ncbi:MAG: DUF342 domain-containing protein, partial [Desulfobacteraceae bacterium]|nr:DUF342 domain-containing protein [Desulfobacteraceae bacterium]
MYKYPLIGKLALKNKFLLKEDLDKALSACSGDLERLEEELIKYLISTKLVSSKNIEKLVSEAKASKTSGNRLKFGEIAIKKGFISKPNLQFMLEEQESDIVKSRKPKLIGDMLIEAGMITSRQRDLILEVQKKFERGNKKSTDTEDNSNIEKSLLKKPVLVSHGLRLQVSADFLSAFLIKTDKFRTSCTVNNIKEILIDKGIIFGIVADEMVVGFLKSHGFKIKPFRVAKGIKPVQGEDAKIAYFFNTEHLKAGGVDSDGQIDFKDRGKIPQVEEDAILAEKTLMVEAMGGKNIYGETILVKPASDIKIQIGKGA